jgi:dihydroorotase
MTPLTPPYDLVVRGGTLIDTAQAIHAPMDLAFAGGRVAQVAPHIPAAEANEMVDATGLLVTPGLVDLHVHAFWGVSHYGIAPDPSFVARGATTVVDAGSAGAATFDGFRRYVIDTAATRILARLNISAQGMLLREIGELVNLKWASVPKALATVERHRDVIVGMKVRLSRDRVVGAGGGLQPLLLAREAADAAGLSLMVHAQEAWCDSLADVLAALRAGDVLTHCFHGRSGGVLDDAGNVLPAVHQAIERGVLLDVGHGSGSFDWDVAERAMAGGLVPHTISSDLHTYSVNGPVFDLATTVSKFLYLGLALDDALAKVTEVPARTLNREGQLGTLRPGAIGDAVLLHLQTGSFDLVDAQGKQRHARQKLVPVTVIKGGQVYRMPAATPA